MYYCIIRRYHLPFYIPEADEIEKNNNFLLTATQSLLGKTDGSDTVGVKEQGVSEFHSAILLAPFAFGIVNLMTRLDTSNKCTFESNNSQ